MFNALMFKCLSFSLSLGEPQTRGSLVRRFPGPALCPAAAWLGGFLGRLFAGSNFFSRIFFVTFFCFVFFPDLEPFWVPKWTLLGSFWVLSFALRFELRFLVFQLLFSSLPAFHGNAKCVFFLRFS